MGPNRQKISLIVSQKSDNTDISEQRLILIKIPFKFFN